MIYSYMTTGQTWDNNKKSASKCPVCDGSGKIEKPVGYGGFAVTFEVHTCHGCDGKGWVTV